MWKFRTGLAPLATSHEARQDTYSAFIVNFYRRESTIVSIFALHSDFLWPVRGSKHNFAKFGLEDQEGTQGCPHK